MVPLLIISAVCEGESRGARTQNRFSGGVRDCRVAAENVTHTPVVSLSHEYHAMMRWEGKGASLVLLLW